MYGYEFVKVYRLLYKRDKRDHRDMLKNMIMMCVRMRRLPYLTFTHESISITFRRWFHEEAYLKFFTFSLFDTMRLRLS